MKSEPVKDLKQDVNRWNISRNGDSSSSKPILIAEPIHRKIPRGASTGQSVRNFSRSYIDDVRDICLHYVRKTSGKYERSEVAARYVHQMAEEVISQLAGVAGEIKKNRGEPEMLQALLNEWNDHFPSSLGELGTPKAIANLVSKQAKELKELQASLDSEKNQRGKILTDMQNSMETQLQVYRNGVLCERRQQQQTEIKTKEKHESIIQELEANHNDEIKQLNNDYQFQINDLQTNYEDKIIELQNTISNLNNNINSLQSEYEKKIELKDNEIKSLKKEVEEIQESYNNLIDKGDTESVFSDTRTINSSNMDSTDKTVDSDCDPEEKKKEKDENYKFKSKLKRQKDKNKFKLLNNEIKNLKVANQTSKGQIESLGFQNAYLEESNKSFIRKLEELNVLNESLRTALHIKVIELPIHNNEEKHSVDNYHNNNNNNELKNVKSPIKKKKKSITLCHTPHFLGPPDKFELRYSEPKISGYNQPGHF